MKKATIITYGCQMNVNDSSKIKKVLINEGYEIIDDIKDSELVIINTCTVRGGAAERVYGKLGELKTLKRQRENLIIGVAGCLAQEKKNEIIEDNPHVDMVIGNQNIYRMGGYLRKIEEKKFAHVVVVDKEDELPPRMDAEFDSDISACVSITYGCNNFCTYCIVPYVRGRERSVPMFEIVEEVRGYVEKGFKEIILLGQNVNSYGKDFDDIEDGDKFSTLLKEICKIPGKFRIRFMSPHPRDFTDKLIDTIAEEEKICKNIHIPVQAGATEVLKRMNRGYSKEEYLNLINKIKNKIPEAVFSTDIIVGFPGETEENFLDTIDVVEKSEFENAYMFMYSKRDGTPASEMENQVDDDVKNERLQRLIEKQNEITKKLSYNYKDKIVEILVEGPTEKNKDMYKGRTDTNKIVLIKAAEGLIGYFVNVKITDIRTWTLYGEVVEV